MALETSAFELLENDGSAFGRNMLIKEIDAMAFRVKKKLDQGIRPDERDAVEKIRTAIDAARNIVDEVWSRNNN